MKLNLKDIVAINSEFHQGKVVSEPAYRLHSHTRNGLNMSAVVERALKDALVRLRKNA